MNPDEEDEILYGTKRPACRAVTDTRCRDCASNAWCREHDIKRLYPERENLKPGRTTSKIKQRRKAKKPGRRNRS